MDWYFRRNSDDLVVPNDKETLHIRHGGDRSSSPNGCFQKKVGRIENYVPPYMPLKPIEDGLNFNWQGLYENFELESSIHDGDGSSSQSAYGDLSFVDSRARTLEASFYEHEHLGDLPDYQLQSSMEQMDDFWESMLLEDSHNMKSVSNSADSAYRSISVGNLLPDIPIDPYNSLKDPCYIGSTSCLKGTSAPMTDDVVVNEEQMEDVSLSSVSDDLQSSEGSPTASVLSVLLPAELITSDEMVGHVQGNKCLEATVLQELENVMSQLNLETRICFRDALYRLAGISKHHRSSIKDTPPSRVDSESTWYDVITFVKHEKKVVGQKMSVKRIFPSCQQANTQLLKHLLLYVPCHVLTCIIDAGHGSSKSTESKTNAIDRTVANLMFNKLGTNPPGLPSRRRIHQYVESWQNSGPYDIDDGMSQSVMNLHQHYPASLPGGIKVSSCRKGNSNGSHLVCRFSCLKPAEAVNYFSDTSIHQAEDSIDTLDQFGPK